MRDFQLSEDIVSLVAKVEGGGRISSGEALSLWEKAPLAVLGVLATGIRERLNGRTVWYNRNIHIEPTNICVFNCSFCSYRRPADSPEAWNHSLEEIERVAREQADRMITEVHIVGGVHPEHDLDYYLEVIRRVKSALPHVTVKAFTAIELAYIIDKAGVGREQGLRMLLDAGMEAMPGGGAEIFDEGVRARICPEKGSTRDWLAMHELAHGLSITSNATMLYGHVENIAHRIDHLDRLRSLQDRTGGFNAFIPLKYRNRGNSLSALGEVGIVEDMRMIALSRIYLDNFPHIKAYWPMLGKQESELALSFGADDIDGTIDDTTRIYSMAGAADTNPAMSVDEIRAMAAAAGYQAMERDTFYNPVKN